MIPEHLPLGVHEIEPVTDDIHTDLLIPLTDEKIMESFVPEKTSREK